MVSRITEVNSELFFVKYDTSNMCGYWDKKYENKNNKNLAVKAVKKFKHEKIN